MAHLIIGSSDHRITGSSLDHHITVIGSSDHRIIGRCGCRTVDGERQVLDPAFISLALLPLVERHPLSTCAPLLSSALWCERGIVKGEMSRTVMVVCELFELPLCALVHVHARRDVLHCQTNRPCQAIQLLVFQSPSNLKAGCPMHHDAKLAILNNALGVDETHVAGADLLSIRNSEKSISKSPADCPEQI